ncbi:hypothetical protein PIB30_040288, partial [Stylosanthes scabra]|nr:hypothetical protein [Stylosanthes scabra]
GRHCIWPLRCSSVKKPHLSVVRAGSPSPPSLRLRLAVSPPFSCRGRLLRDHRPSSTELLLSPSRVPAATFAKTPLPSTPNQDAIFRIVAVVLHLGNIEFVRGDDEETDSSKPKDDKSRFHLKTVAELLMIVDKINNSIGQDPNSKNLIGVLDIYGFESFKTNSFEQFCINLTNEKLQQHFNQHVFKMEQEEYTKEEINWSYIEFVDNQDVLDLIEKKPGGVIALLDEACMLPRSTHETFAEKLYQTFKDNKRFSKPKVSRTDFTINHYAGDVSEKK